LNTNPLVADSDCDGISDGIEVPLAGLPVSDPLDNTCAPAGNTCGAASSNLFSFDDGSTRLGNWAPTGGMTITVNTSAPTAVDGTSAVKFQSIGNSYQFANMNFSARNLSNTNPSTALNFDIYGDNSGSVMRIVLHNGSYSEFLYKDFAINWSGWKHFALRLDGNNGGMDKWGLHSRNEILAGINILQVGAPIVGTIPTTFYMDNVRVVSSGMQTIELGNSRRGTWGSPSISSFVLTPNSTAQQVDGTLSVKVQTSTAFGFRNLNYDEPLDVTPCSSVEFDVYGDNSGAVVRFEWYSTSIGAFAYTDVTLNYIGWRHYAFKLDGSDGLLNYPTATSMKSILSTGNIFQVSGPWNGIATTFHFDNVAFGK